jgi:hypothetical protein
VELAVGRPPFFSSKTVPKLYQIGAVFGGLAIKAAFKTKKLLK